MKKAPLLITVGIIVLAAAGYFVYEMYFHKQQLTPWDLVPENTVAVYEAGTCAECIEPVRNSSLWTIINKAAFYNKKRDSIQAILSFLTAPRAGSLASMHVTKKDDFDFVFYVPFKTLNERKLFEATMTQWEGKKTGKFSVREFNAIKIHEFSTKDCAFSWVLLDNVWVGSFTPFLVEDIIRVHTEGDGVSFRQKIADVYKMPKMKNDAGNLYVHLANLADWLAVFAPESSPEFIKYFGKAALLDVKAEEQNLVLNGFSLDDPTHQSILSVFTDQSPTSFSLKQFVSNRTVMLASYGISDGAQFGKRLMNSGQRSASVQDTLNQLTKSLHIPFNDLYSSINNEVGVCYVESGGQSLSKILLVETTDASKWTAVLNKLAEQFSTDTIFYEPFANYEIREIPLYQLPAKLFSPFTSGFDHSYYSVANNTVIIGDDLESLKNFLSDIDKEETWGKSVSQNKFLESTLLESNISLYVNTPRIWNILNGLVSEKWRTFIQENRAEITSAGMGAIQFSHLNQSFYTNISWMYKEPGATVASNTERTKTVVTGFNKKLSSSPIVVRSHVDKSDEVIVQDSAHQVHLVSAKGDVLWSKQLNGPIIGEVFQIDYFKNGKLQYYFVTAGTLHIIDRLGNYVAPFPVATEAKDIEFNSVIDYDHSMKYRFLVADKAGKLWMYDKEGKNLEGWNARNVEDGLFASPRHFRIKGKDYVIAIRKDGTVYLMNRRGESLKGFPLKLDARPSGDYYLEQGSTTENTFFVLVSRDGFRIKFNLQGKVHTRETLLKTSVEARFSLVNEQDEKSYVIVRQEPKGLVIFDKELKELIRNDYMGLNPTRVRFYDFGAGRLYYLVTDTTQDLTYIYDAQLNLITSPPLEAYGAVLRPLNSDKATVYFTYDRSLGIKSLF